MMLTFSQLLALLGQEPVALWGDWLRAFAASGRFDLIIDAGQILLPTPAPTNQEDDDDADL